MLDVQVDTLLVGVYANLDCIVHSSVKSMSYSSTDDEMLYGTSLLEQECSEDGQQLVSWRRTR